MPPSKVVPLEITNDEVVRSQKTTVVKDIIGLIVTFGGMSLFFIVGTCIFFGVIALVSTPIFLFISYTIETYPCLSIESIIPVTPVNVTYAQNPSSTSPSSSITGSWNVSFGLYNRAHAKITYYDHIDVMLYYRNASIGHTTIHISQIHQGKSKTWIHMATRIDTESTCLDDMAAYGLARDIKDGTIEYAVEVVVHARIVPSEQFGRKSTLKFDTRHPGTDLLSKTLYKSCAIMSR